MKNRRAVVATLSVVTGAAALAPFADDDVGHGDSAPGAVRPSDAAFAIAQTYRRFDAALSDTEIAAIAAGIDAAQARGRAINPPGESLRNGDDLAVRFAAGA